MTSATPPLPLLEHLVRPLPRASHYRTALSLIRSQILATGGASSLPRTAKRAASAGVRRGHSEPWWTVALAIGSEGATLMGCAVGK
ncbi:hypothetical protein B7463_g12450, partial [Scytalidium lignicola]